MKSFNFGRYEYTIEAIDATGIQKQNFQAIPKASEMLLNPPQKTQQASNPPDPPQMKAYDPFDRNAIIKDRTKTLKSVGHGGLDAVGMVPGLGEIADGINGIWYLAEGDNMSATASFAAMIPFVGWASTGTKYELKLADNFIKNADDFYKAVNKLDITERIPIFKDVGEQMASNSGWTKNTSLMSKNKGRTIYTDAESGLHYSLDTQHGGFEVLSKKGKHMGEIDFNGVKKKGADKSGGHDINIK